MNTPFFTRTLLSVVCAALFGFTGSLQAHSGGAVLDAGGSNPSATALAEVSCFDDGNGEPAYLLAQVQDNSEPVDGLLLSLQLYKGVQATNITDPVSGDAEPSDFMRLDGGLGTYRMILDKTAAGPRAFEVTWHCETADGVHTGTDIVVRQFQ
ncbi:MAG: hypothetical protein ACU84J_12675 [Gammaproteobacteria bacterium]